MPLTATLKLAEFPMVTEAEFGCVEINGALTAVATANVATLLVADPALLVTTTI